MDLRILFFLLIIFLEQFSAKQKKQFVKIDKKLSVEEETTVEPGFVADPTTMTPEPTTMTPEPTTMTPELTTMTPEPTTKTQEPTTTTQEPTTTTPEPTTTHQNQLQ